MKRTYNKKMQINKLEDRRNAMAKRIKILALIRKQKTIKQI